MDAAVWTAIGLLAATSLGNLFYLGSRIDASQHGWPRALLGLIRGSTASKSGSIPSQRASTRI
jgi:hypothetical protein